MTCSFFKSSSLVLVAWALFVPSSFKIIFANGEYISSQSMEDKWSLSFNESLATIHEGDPKRFSLVYYIHDSIASENTAGHVFTEDCLESLHDNTTGTATNLGISNITTSVVTPGEAIFEFDLDMATLVQNENVTENLPDQSGIMKMCSRFSLQTADGSYEVNYLENLITINFAFDGDFSLVFDVGPIEKLLDKGQQGYDVTAYLCDPARPDEILPDNVPIQPGGVLSVCVLPTQEALDDGLMMRSIDNFKWFRGLTEQPVVEEGLQAGNSLSILVCEPDTKFCTMQSILYAAFFQPTQAPSEFPSVAPSELPSSDPTNTPTPAPTPSPTYPPTPPPTACSKSCFGWRQTGGCSPYGPRESNYDQGCYVFIHGSWSGYCECQNGERVNFYCGHGMVYCQNQCEVSTSSCARRLLDEIIGVPQQSMIEEDHTTTEVEIPDHNDLEKPAPAVRVPVKRNNAVNNDDPPQQQRKLEDLTISGAGSATLKFPTRRRLYDKSGRLLEEDTDSAQTEIPTVYASLVPITDEDINLQTSGACNYCLSSVVSKFVVIFVIGAVTVY